MSSAGCASLFIPSNNFLLTADTAGEPGREWDSDANLFGQGGALNCHTYQPAQPSRPKSYGDGRRLLLLLAPDRSLTERTGQGSGHVGVGPARLDEGPGMVST